MPTDPPPPTPDDPFPEEGGFDARHEWFARRLEGRSREDCILIAARSAMRVLPNLTFVLPKDVHSEKGDESARELIFPLTRAYILPSIIFTTARETTRLVEQKFKSHAASAVYDAEYATTVAAAYSAYEAYSAHIAFESVIAACDALAYADIAIAIADADADTGYAAFEADLALLDGSHEARVRLATSRLWLNKGGAPQEILDNWNAFSTQLRALGDGWDVWVDWYGGYDIFAQEDIFAQDDIFAPSSFPGVLQGAQDGRYIFGLPTARALKLWQDVALLDNDLWQGEPAALNARFKELVRKALEEGSITIKAETTLPDVTPKPPKAAPKAKSAPKPKTALGKAVLANAGVLALQIELMFPLIDREIARLREELWNSDEAQAERDEKIAFLEQIKANASALKQSVLDFPEAKVSEAELKKITNAFFKKMEAFWEKGGKFLEISIRSGLLLGGMSIMNYMGMSPSKEICSLALSAIVAEKTLVNVLKAAKGVIKINISGR